MLATLMQSSVPRAWQVYSSRRSTAPSRWRQWTGSCVSWSKEFRGIAPEATRIILTAESARAVLFCHAIMSVSARVVSIVFGGARDADLMNDLECGWSSDGPELIHARQHMLLGARAAGIKNPLDGAFTDIRDKDGFERDIGAVRAGSGYRGRMFEFIPTRLNRRIDSTAARLREIDYCMRVVSAFEIAVARGEAATTVDGRMIDEAMAQAAREVLAEVGPINP